MDNVKYLGIDFGLKKVGLAIGISGFAEPLKVIRYKDIKLLVKKIAEIAQKEQVDKIVVGVSEAEMGKSSKEFAKLIGAVTFDETLSTKDAIRMSIESGIGRKKRKGMEDAYAASIMLQNFLDNRLN